MHKHGSRITVLMLVAVFCAFAFVGCGETKDNATTESTDQTTSESKQTNADDNSAAADRIKLSISSPAEGDTVEGGTVNVVGKAEGVTETDGDTVKIELTTEDGKMLGESSSLIADLDYEFSADLKYTIGDDAEKAEDGSVNARLRVYMDDNEGNVIKDKTVDLKVK